MGLGRPGKKKGLRGAEGPGEVGGGWRVMGAGVGTLEGRARSAGACGAGRRWGADAGGRVFGVGLVGRGPGAGVSFSVFLERSQHQPQ